MADNSTNWFVEAVNAGLSPIPVDTASKRPLQAWKRFQEFPADLLQCQQWADRNIGIVCGQVSGRLICIDIEAAFLEGHGLAELAKRLRIGEVYDVWWSWMEGYCESTPSGGLHVLIHMEGDGPLAGNTKLASDPDGHTLIETRGEGGYTIIAPSRNGTRGWELLRGGLSSIAYATLDEWSAVAAVLTSFDAAEPPPPPVVRPTVGPSLGLGGSWIDDEKARLPTIEAVLLDLGWSAAKSSDAYGQHWVRPDKDPREGHSASVNHDSGRLWVHSTNAGLPVGVSLDALDVILWRVLGHIPTLEDRTDYLRAQRPVAARGAAPAPADGAVSSLHLPEEFWNATPLLTQVFEASRSRLISPDAVLGALLSTYATTIPMGIWLPAVVSARAPLNIFACLVAASGGGKTGSIHLALDLVGRSTNPNVLLARSLRSGEGLVNLAIRPRPKGSDLSEPPSFRNAVQICFDEGAALAKQSDRAGSTTIPYLNTAWAGLGVVGGAKAGESGYFPADLVRICAVMGVQYGAAANLFTGESASMGFPQRLLFFGLHNPSLADLDVDEMSAEPVDALHLPVYEHAEFSRVPQYIGVPPAVMREVRLWTQAKDHGGGLEDRLDGHRMNLRLRVAAIFALMEGRFDIDVRDWELSIQVEGVSRCVRSNLLQSLGDVTIEKAKAAGRNDAVRRIAESNVYVERAAMSLARKVQHTKEPFERRQIKDHLRSYKRRHGVDLQIVIDVAVQRQWIVIHKDGSISPGRTLVGGSGGS